MDLIVNQFGTRIRRAGERIVLFDPKRNARKELPARKLSKIVILGSCSISAGAVELALDRDIDVVFLGKFGMPIGRLVPSKQGALALLRQKQAEASGTEAATAFAKAFLSAKGAAQIRLLRTLSKTERIDLSEGIETMSSFLRLLEQVAGPVSVARPRLLGLEGSIAHHYFQCLQKLVPFPGRVGRGAEDPFNVLLNYGYGILYNELERCCLHAGLDPHIGFLHADRPGSRSLVFDLIEELRVPLVDAVVVRLLLEERQAGTLVSRGTLLPKGRKALISRIYSLLGRSINWQGQRMTVRTAMRMQAYHLSHVLTGKAPAYIPFPQEAFE